ncbi:MAG: hypothetical protein ACRENE_18015 [Polyangiaceae bacterium]
MSGPEPPAGAARAADPSAVESLIEGLRRSTDPRTLATVQELVRALLDLHAAGLARVMEIAGEGGREAGRGAALRDALAADPSVAALLLLHGLHPVPLVERARKAVEKAALAGWQVEVEAHEGRLDVSMKRVGDRRRAVDAGRARALVEQALEQVAPDAEEVLVTGDVDEDAAGDFVPLERVAASAAAAGGAR